jgi:hypothetical protein
MDKPNDPTIFDLATSGVVPAPDRSVQAPQVRDIHGIKSTKLPQLDLLPKAALVALANRMELGIARKGIDGVWNHRKETSVEFAIERLSHVIHHAYDAIDKLKRGVPFEGEDDAGAILFGGAVLAVYKDNIVYGEAELLQGRENAKKVFGG